MLSVGGKTGVLHLYCTNSTTLHPFLSREIFTKQLGSPAKWQRTTFPRRIRKLVFYHLFESLLLNKNAGGQGGWMMVNGCKQQDVRGNNRRRDIQRGGVYPPPTGEDRDTQINKPNTQGFSRSIPNPQHSLPVWHGDLTLFPATAKRGAKVCGEATRGGVNKWKCPTEMSWTEWNRPGAWPTEKIRPLCSLSSDLLPVNKPPMLAPKKVRKIQTHTERQWPKVSSVALSHWPLPSKHMLHHEFTFTCTDIEMPKLCFQNYDKAAVGFIKLSRTNHIINISSAKNLCESDIMILNRLVTIITISTCRNNNSVKFASLIYDQTWSHWCSYLISFFFTF